MSEFPLVIGFGIYVTMNTPPVAGVPVPKEADSADAAKAAAIVSAMIPAHSPPRTIHPFSTAMAIRPS